jgi:hypothetical protein
MWHRYGWASSRTSRGYEPVADGRLDQLLAGSLAVGVFGVAGAFLFAGKRSGHPAAEPPAAPPIDANWPIELSGTLVAPITVDAAFTAAGPTHLLSAGERRGDGPPTA